ncbi:hypothetical protein [Rathayibacter sp. VKM Ac-2857]|uniref:hypothetical protein n=1 Tax=Rathayibacter sp. VKM Ac-2857 TaxID=2739020 RepID=UPI0015648693|nr:hypothetical protein [Rathayibacter sp. VKM Ac-2857]NQX16857.1 hypothetical protein [Rathayibacter sp. VKM Ac-2857]
MARDDVARSARRSAGPLPAPATSIRAGSSAHWRCRERLLYRVRAVLDSIEHNLEYRSVPVGRPRWEATAPEQ